MESLRLRFLELSDLDFLEQIENDTSLWKYSDTTTRYSKSLLVDYISNAKQDLRKVGQQRFVLTDTSENRLGIIDFFDFKLKHARAAVGIVITDEWRRKGFGKKGMQLLEEKAIRDLKLHQLYAGIAVENKVSRALFKAQGYKEIGVKKDWNFYNKSYHDEVIVQKILDAHV